MSDIKFYLPPRLDEKEKMKKSKPETIDILKQISAYQNGGLDFLKGFGGFFKVSEYTFDGRLLKDVPQSEKDAWEKMGDFYNYGSTRR